MNAIESQAERDALIDALNDAFNRKFQSLAQYILDARPYVPPGAERALAELRAQAAEDRELAAQTAAVIEELEGIPQLRPRSASDAELNYLALDYLLGVLIGAREQEMRAYDAYGRRWSADGTARAVWERLRSTTAAQLERLRALRGEASSRPDA